MAMYTEFWFRAHLRADTPPALLDWFEAVAATATDQPYDGHQFFQTRRWLMALTGYDEVVFSLVGPPFQFTRGTEDSWDNARLVIHTSFVHYDGEIQAFVDWISPFLKASPGEFLGYSLYEDTDFDGMAPTLIRMRDPDVAG